MTDFEIQRRLRELNTPRAPQTDLWSGIATRIAGETAPVAHRRGRWLPLAAAAALLLAVIAGTLVLGVRQQNIPQDVAATDAGALSSKKLRVSSRDAQDFARAPGGDPRLVGAAVVLDAAHAELEQALDQRPDAVFLVSLLNRTNARRMKLDHFGANAG
ncbi:hypothetical protein [Dokdonella soli]|uniref:DUF3379 domain-containing protein n=1 Tax=Dokdonella soli TaxID=529810 RepID=A0ABP3TUK3_9GAMM